MSLFTDQEILIGLRNNDHRSFRYLYEKYWDKLYLSACKRLDDEFDAEEVVQDVFCNLWRKRGQLELKTNFEAYLSVAVKYEILNRFAKKAKDRVYQHYAISNYSELEYTTTDQVNYHEIQHQLELTVNTLPDKCRTAFKLSREQGYTNKQISALMDISIKTVEAHISKALRLLRITFGSTLFLVVFFLS